MKTVCLPFLPRSSRGLKQRDGDPDLFNRAAGLGGIYKRNTGPESPRAETQRIAEGMGKKA